MKPLIFTAPDLKEAHEIFMSQDDACSVVARMETKPLRITEILVEEKLHPVAVREMLFCKLLRLHTMDQAERRYRTGLLGIYNINFYIASL